MPLLKKRMLTWKRALSGLICAVALYVGYALCGIYHMVHVVIPHSYAAWDVGNLLVEYMDTHNGKWPQSWKNLHEAEDSLRQKGKNVYWNFDELPSIVKIDWNAEPEALAKNALAGGNLKIVTQLDGSRLEAKWGPDTEPNRKVAEYLIKRHSTNSVKSAVTSP